jgi:3-amino-4-hydroxybenzoic acid synthase
MKKNLCKKTVWFDARKLNNEEEILTLIFNLSFENLLVSYDLFNRIKPPHRMKLVVETGENTDVETLPIDTIIFSDNHVYLKDVQRKGYQVAFYYKIENALSMEKAWQLGYNMDYLIGDICDETNIPLELLIARLQSSNTRVLKKVTKKIDMEIAFGVMESGSDGILLDTEDVSEIMEVDRYMMQQELGKLQLEKGVVVDVRHIGMGYRACIDTTSFMKQNEGMLIGSTSNGGLLVSSETHYLPYMELRPFRVNAGAIHSYVWCPDGMTSYLTELKTGSKVLCVDTEGNTREIVVGRSKTELRPLLKIEVEAGNKLINVVVQDDWHIRLFNVQGEPVNASTIKRGDQLLAFACQGGRHVGLKISEVLEEQ